MMTGKYQWGMSTAGWLFTVGLAGFFMTLLFKMGPAYLANMGVRSAMNSMVRNSDDIHTLDKAKIYSQMGNYFTINNVRDHQPKDLKIIRSKDKTLINHVYETRVPVFFNVDVVMKFKNQIDSSNIKECCKYLVDDEKPAN